jgi:hypothetical protein
VYRKFIEHSVSRGRNGKAIWQDLVSDHGFAGSDQTVKRFVRNLRGPQHPEAAGIILTAAGEEAQVDYGSGPMVRDPQSGKYRRTQLFVMTLGYSRKSVRWLAWRSSARRSAELHEKAFRRLGGCPRVVLDNLKEGVAVPDIYDPTINTVSRCARTLGPGGAALPDPRSGSQRKSGIRHRSHLENSAQRDALRKSGTGASLSGSLGRTLGGYAHSWHNQTAGRGHVRRRKTAPAATTPRTLPRFPST